MISKKHLKKDKFIFYLEACIPGNMKVQTIEDILWLC